MEMVEQPEENVSRAALLPEDVLGDILARLAPRGLATARAVCREWRAAVDGRRLLRADLLPLSLDGIFVNFFGHPFPEYFARPSSSTVSGAMDHLPVDGKVRILGHCNGLLLADNYDLYVVNPATRWWARLPPPPPRAAPEVLDLRHYLVFDPTMSPHYEVLSISDLHATPTEPEKAEWPPSTCVSCVFSSQTSRWEERLLIREEGAIAAMSDIRTTEESYAYWKGALYIHCNTDFILRLSLSENKYSAIKRPNSVGAKKSGFGFYLGKSEKGVYLAFLDHCNIFAPSSLFWVWMLNESHGRMEWCLKHHCDLTDALYQNWHQRTNGPWVLQDVNYNVYRDTFPNHNKETPMEENYEWDSDNDNFVATDSTPENHGCLSILGFHPFKEIVFFAGSNWRGLAYHLKSSKVQDLGNLYPTEYEYFAGIAQDLELPYPYTPCWM
ncbi:hypothetical protein ACP70R_025112 [Stipagrostis hirtigluma subsp. patula]